ncbi:hypothetical protein EVAR_56797_1 [Eumeta japonica]|uniref:Uncharacterized protein n=1 Tax=Eumeta variegata TaxID=151549 RepID=A0A4C1Y1I9_EUMVA|nr:hypothetical protein EVAR_56797_1 [Eumeta japonica]
MVIKIAPGAVAHKDGSEDFAIGRRSRHNFPRNIGRFLPYKAMNLFPGRFLGRCRVQPEPDRAIADASSVYAVQPLQWVTDFMPIIIDATSDVSLREQLVVI